MKNQAGVNGIQHHNNLSWKRYLIPALLFAISYLLVEKAYITITGMNNLRVWYPSAGIAFAFGHIIPPVGFLIISACDFFSRTYWQGLPITQSSVIYSLMVGALYSFIPYILRKAFKFDFRKITLSTTGVLFLSGLFTAIVLAVLKYLTQPIPRLMQPDFPVNSIIYFTLQYCIGMITVGMFVLTIYEIILRYPVRKTILNMAKNSGKVINEGAITKRRAIWVRLVIVTAISYSLVFLLDLLPGTESMLLFAFFAIPIYYSAISFERRRTTIIILAIFISQIVFGLNRHIYLSEAIEHQLFSIAVLVIAYLINAFINERRQLFLDFSQSEKRFQTVSDLSPIGYCMVDSTGWIKYSNKMFQSIVNMDEGIINSQNLINLIHPQDAPELVPMLEEVYQHATQREIKLRLRKSDEEYTWMQAVVSLLHIDEGSMPSFIVAFTDISGMVQREESALSSAKILSSFINSLPDPAWMKDLEGRYIALNQELIRRFYNNSNSTIGMKDDELLPPERAKFFNDTDRMVIQTEKPLRFEMQERDDNHLDWYETIKTPWFEDGKVMGTVGISRDITEHRLIQNALKESEYRTKSLLNNIPDVVWMKDQDKRFIAVNHAFCKRYGLSEEDVLGKTGMDLFDETYAINSDMDEELIMQKREAHTSEESFVDLDGSLYWYEVIKVPVIDQNDAIIGITGVARDITHRKQYEESIQKRLLVESIISDIATRLNQISRDESKNTLIDVLQQLGDFIQADRCAFLTFTEEEGWAVSISEWQSRNFPGSDFYIPTDFKKRIPAIWKGIVDGTQIEVTTVSGRDYKEINTEIATLTKNPAPHVFCLPLKIPGSNDYAAVWVESWADDYYWQEENWQLLKLCGEMLVITHARLMGEEKLRQAETKYRYLVEQLAAVVYIDNVDEVSSGIYMSPRIYDLTGYSSEEILSAPDFFWNIIHPDDLENVKNENDRTNISGEPFRMEYRLVTKDGRIVWVLDHAIINRDITGKPIWHGVLYDVTEEKRIREELSVSQERYHDLFDHTPISLWEVDFSQVKKRLDGLSGKGIVDIQKYLITHPKEVNRLRNLVRIIDVNQATLNLFNIADKKEIIEQFAQTQQFKPDDLFIQQMAKVAAGETHFSIEGANDIYDGVVRYHNLHLLVVPGFEATFGRAILAVTDITDRKITEEQLIFLSAHDHLTGLFSRSYFQAEMERLQNSRQFPISILISDLDYLKETNDRFGHAAGDALLQRAAQVLRMTFRPEDVVARIGGDEFAVLLPKTDSETGQKLTLRLQSMIQLENSRNSDPNRLDLSIGVATAHQNDKLEEILKLADSRMYNNKFDHHEQRQK